MTPSEPVSGMVDRDLGNAIGIDSAGEKVMYQSVGAMPEAGAGELVPSNLVVRTASGWQPRPPDFLFEITYTNLALLLSPMYVALNDDLTTSIQSSVVPLLPGAPELPEVGIYRTADGKPTLLARFMGVEQEEQEGRGFVGASKDLEHVVFKTRDHLLPSDAGRGVGTSIYEAFGSDIRQLDVANDGSLLSQCGSTASMDAVSDSGEDVFFTNPSPDFADPAAECGALRRVFMRKSGSSTVEASASRCTRPDCNAPQNVDFAGAAADGSAVFLRTSQQLTNADKDSLPDLYRYDVVDDSLSLLSTRSADASGEVVGTVQASADGSVVYFYANGRLLSGQGSETEDNLYIAGQAGLHLVGATANTTPPLVSENGRFALIATARPLVSSDTDESIDAYRYDADSDQLARVSDGPNGGNGAFNVSLTRAVPLGSGGFGLPVDSPFTGSLTQDGRVFFDTAEPLVGDDHNETADVYEWSGGESGLVSAGSKGDDAEFAGSTPNGGTALIRTTASLLPVDHDGGDLDLYAARIGGGFMEPAPSGPGCDPCRPGPAGPVLRPRATTTRSPKAEKGQIKLRRLPDGIGVKAIATGAVPLTLYVPAPGKVSATARASVGGKSRTAAQGIAGAVSPGDLNLLLSLSTAAHRELSRRGVLRLHLVLRQGDAQLKRDLLLTTRAGK